MAQLMMHGRKIDTVFELLGRNENAMTYSLGWALAGCNVFCQELAAMLGIKDGFSDAMHIRPQAMAGWALMTGILTNCTLVYD